MAVLHPDVVARADFGGRRLPAPAMIRGAATVAENARGRPTLLMAFTVSEGKIAAFDVYGDRDRVRRLTGALRLTGRPS